MASKKSSIDRFLRSMEYDPLVDVYKERAKMRKARSKGVERFAFELFGTDLIGSVAFALDTVTSLPKKFPNDKVSPVRRTRNVSGIPAQTRTGFRVQYNRSHSTFTPFDPFYGSFTASPDNNILIDGRESIPLQGQDSLLGYIKDTSVKTRDHGVLQGEMELFVPRLKASPISYHRKQANNLIITNLPSSYYETTKTWEDLRYGFYGPSIRVTKDGYHSFVSSYINSANDLLNESVLDLVASTLPSKRKYSLARNILELKDLPKLLRDSVKYYNRIFVDLKFHDLPGTSDLYLTYLFGWKQLVNDIRNLLRAPEQVAKDINFFVARQGRPTTLRSFRRISRVLAIHPDFETEVFDLFDEPAVSSSQEVFTSELAELRVAINCNIEFPKVDVPAIKDLSFFLHKLGADLSPADIYDVVPWTWLTDWFTGASDYFHLLEEISYDQSLINYGLISLKGVGKSTCNYVSSVEKTDAVVESVPYNYTGSPISFSANRSAEFSWRSHIRKDLTTVLSSLKTTSGKGLTPSQLSIVTALTAQRVKPRRR